MIKLIGILNLGSDATLNVVNGKQVVNFNAAHTDKYKNQQGVETSKTTWISCNYWSDKVGIVPYLKKGTQVYLEGNIEAKTYTDKQGVVQPQLVSRINTIQLLGSKPQETRNIDNTNTDNDLERLKDEDSLPF